ncbi:hypothetical protein PR001_g29557 [Phytophthora rubi]|uniref:Uncharacterized protein n=1 Tax=Phytophthora rubi TaxID=129364 RepID=A0A6A3H1C2_9STRA|nr:hypothetical protein PR001_g29557 [Phytophthora rubi]KAE8973029.1 hypothetical protein PR002_g26328 [Phytophthora rubi]
MITRGTTDQASPSFPSSIADSAPTDRELPPAAAAVAPPDVVDVTGSGEPWTTAPARRTTEAAPLRTSKRATPKAVPGEAPADASKARKKVAKRATVASISGPPRKTASDGDEDSGSDLEDKPPGPPAKRPRKATASAKAKPAKPTASAAAAKRPSALPRSDGGFDLHEFMASFSPGTAREDIAAPVERAEPEESPTAQASASREGVATQHDPAAGDQVQALQAEVERLRALVAGQGLAQLPVSSIPFPHANSSAPTAPNSKGELPPAEVRYLTTASFPEGAKRAKGDYNPPQAHLLAASRMFRAFGTEHATCEIGARAGNFPRECLFCSSPSFARRQFRQSAGQSKGQYRHWRRPHGHFDLTVRVGHTAGTFT